MSDAFDSGARGDDVARTVQDAVQDAVRDSYGRLVAILAARTRDVALAEDALADAVLAAFEQWPAHGVPRSPDAWLLTVARRRLADGSRHDAVRERAEPALAYAATLMDRESPTGDERLPDRRAELLFACADPAIDASIRTPLMLQAVLGLEAATIANAYLMPPSAMAQRLVRAKRKIRDAGIAFRVPDAGERTERLGAVLDALYAGFGTAWSWIDGSAPGGAEERVDLRDETIHLARVLAAALPDEPEVEGLLALMLYCTARDDARRDADGRYVPLSAQSADAWDTAAIGEAETRLLRAAARRQPGRYQLEAAIQSAHLGVAFGHIEDLTAIARLYDALADVAPTVAVYVNRAAAHARAFGAAVGLSESERLPSEAVASYQPYWALRAHLLRELGRGDDAMHARERAIGLTEDPAVRRYLIALD